MIGALIKNDAHPLDLDPEGLDVLCAEDSGGNQFREEMGMWSP